MLYICFKDLIYKYILDPLKKIDVKYDIFKIYNLYLYEISIYI